MIHAVFMHTAIQLAPKSCTLLADNPYMRFLSGCKWEVHLSSGEDEMLLRITPKHMPNIETIDLYVKLPRKGAVTSSRVRAALIEALLPRVQLLNLSLKMLEDGHER